MTTLNQYEYKIRGKRGINFVDGYNIEDAIKHIKFDHGVINTLLKVKDLKEWEK